MPDDVPAPGAQHPLAGVQPPVGGEATFNRLLVNTLVSGVTSSFVWFALTFWVFLETRSVVVTGVIGGAFGISGALLGPPFGTYVDHHRKHTAMAAATTVSAISFAVATAVFVAIDAESLLQLTNPWFWLLAGATLFGSVAGNLRGVALATCVTLLVPADRRDRANGRVGTVNGMAFAITSVFSGLVIGYLGMGWALYGTLTLTVAALVHLQGIHIDEPEPDPASPSASSVDIKGALDAIRGVPGLSLLIFLAAFNNLLGGVFLALIDPYGLSLVSVQAWGFLWGFISLAMILGGLAVAKFGLGPRPLRVLLGGNLIAWTVCAAFTLQSSIVLLGAGMVIWMFLMPSIEASEQTVLQRLIPYERQGRVFGFAQLVENAASPITAFLMAPLAEAVFMPLMTDGAGADAIGSWFGTGEERGLALLFTIAGILGVINTALVWRSRSFHRLQASWQASVDADDAEPAAETVPYGTEAAAGSVE
jgi:DHA3 family multidrug efflux protein-like MFS transporter